MGTTTRLPHCWLRLGALVWLVVLSGAIELQAEDPTQCSTALRAVEDQRGTALPAVEAPANENLLHNHWLLTGQVAADTQSADSLDSQNWLVDPRTADPYVLPVAMLASGAHAPSRVPLSQLSDAELLQLYTQMYQQSLRTELADSAAMVSPGRLLLQVGYTYSYDRHLGAVNSVHTLPELLLRYRLWDRLELRLAWAGVVWDHLQDTETQRSDWDTRLSDPSVGARIALWSQRAWIPRTSLTIASPLNVESPASLTQRLDPFVGFGYSWCWDDVWLVSGSSAAVWTRAEDHRYLDFQQVLSLEWLGHDRWGAFVEWSVLLPEGAPESEASHLAGPGVCCNVTREMQCEAAVLFGLDHDSPDLAVQLLVSWRL